MPESAASPRFGGMNRVLITGGRAPVALDLARHFAAAGMEVFVADSAAYFLARASRAVSRSLRVPPPRQEPQAFAEAIGVIVRREKIELIVPTCEEVFFVARHAERLRGEADLFCAEFSLLAELHDKWRFTRLAQDLGIGVPETWRLASPAHLRALPVPSEELVFKPVFSRFAMHTLVQPKAAEVAALAPRVERPWVAQRFVAGRELCSYSIARDGRLCAHALYVPLWRAGRGSGYYFSPQRVPAIEAFVARFVAKTRYTGQIAFDFIESPDGGMHVLECNPRATSGLHLFALKDGLARAFAHEPGEILRPANDRPGMLGTAMLTIGVVDALRHGKFRALAADWHAARDVLWSRSDPWPAFYVFAGLGATLATAALRGITPQAASTRDLEWDGEDII